MKEVKTLLEMEEKPCKNINQGWEAIWQKHKANEKTSRHNLNIKQKQTINQKSDKDTMQRGLMTTK